MTTTARIAQTVQRRTERTTHETARGRRRTAPQEVALAYHRLLLLGETDGRVDLDRVELGPALPDGTDAVELDRLASWFSQLTRLQKLASPQVLRECLVNGVRTDV